MPATNPWLAGPAPTKKLDPRRLDDRILNLLSSQNMCVLATSGPQGPLATPVRYYHLDFAVMFTASVGAEDAQHRGRSSGVSRGVRSAGRPGQ